MANDTIKVAYLSGTRADFGLMQSSLLQLQNDKRFSLTVLVTGMHLAPAYGNTVEEIENAGLPIAARIYTDVQSRTGAGMAIAVAQTIEGLVTALQKNRPDILLLLGDRGEMLAGALASMHLGIVTVHVHGGERSGTVDEPIRHAISKISHYHLTATEQARDRLIRMGEKDSSIFVTGAPGLDGVKELAQSVISGDFYHATGLQNGSDFILCIFHPVVQQAYAAFEQTSALMRALCAIGKPVLWCTPNADAGSEEILRAMALASLPHGSVILTHLSRPLFCAAMQRCALMVGNSSSGIIEAASLGTPVLNIGDRQLARETSANVWHALANDESLLHGMRKLLALGKQEYANVYGNGNAGLKIVDALSRIPLDAAILEKSNAY